MSVLAFLRPELLWGLAAASLPVIIHLINRHRARRHRFAAIDFLFRVQRKSARRILLKQLLLLMIRTLLIAALVLAAAGPVIHPEGVAPRTGPGTSCLVLDASLSMRTRVPDGTLFGLAVERARRLVRSLAPGDKACLVVAGQQVRTLVGPCSASPGPLLDALDKLEANGAEFGTSDLAAAMESAAGLLADDPAPNKRLVLLTDAAAHALGRAPAWPAGQPPPQVELHEPAPDRPRVNHAITQVDQAAAGNLLELSVRLVQYGPEPVADLPAEVWLGDAPVVRGFVTLEPNAPTRKMFSLRPPEGGPQPGRIAIRPDALTEDDGRAFYAAGRRLLQVLLINGDMRPVLHRDELYFLEHALSPAGPGAAGIRFTSVTPDRVDAGLVQAAQVVFLANVNTLSDAVVERLRDFVAGGGGLFVAMGDRVDIERTNQMLTDLLPWRLRDVVALGPRDPDGQDHQGLPFGPFDAAHPALAIFNRQGHQSLSAVRTRRAVVLEPGRTASQSRVLIHYTNGAPALVEGRLGAGRVLLFTSSLDLDWTSWPARATYLPFLQHAVAYLAGTLDEQPPPEVTVGDPVRLPLITEADRLLVQPPDGEAREIRARSDPERWATYTRTDRPGWYAIEQRAGPRKLAGGSIPGFFVRPPVAESDPTPLGTDRLRGLLGQQTRFRVAGESGDSSHSKTGLLLLLVLALALCEAVLVRR